MAAVQLALPLLLPQNAGSATKEAAEQLAAQAAAVQQQAAGWRDSLYRVVKGTGTGIRVAVYGAKHDASTFEALLHEMCNLTRLVRCATACVCCAVRSWTSFVVVGGFPSRSPHIPLHPPLWYSVFVTGQLVESAFAVAALLRGAWLGYHGRSLTPLPMSSCRDCCQGCVGNQMIDAAALGGPKVAVLSTLTSVSPACPFMFTNYELPPEAQQHAAALRAVSTSSKHLVWQVRHSPGPLAISHGRMGHQLLNLCSWMNLHPPLPYLHDHG